MVYARRKLSNRNLLLFENSFCTVIWSVKSIQPLGYLPRGCLLADYLFIVPPLPYSKFLKRGAGRNFFQKVSPRIFFITNINIDTITKNLLFQFVPKVVAIGVHNSVGKFFSKPGVVDGQVAQQLLHVFALSVLVGRARVMYDG